MVRYTTVFTTTLRSELGNLLQESSSVLHLRSTMSSGSLLLSLPEDLLLNRICSLLPARSLLSLLLSCRSLRLLLSAHPAPWLRLCLSLPSPLPLPLLHLWLPHLPSPIHLYRFLLLSQPLLGLWSHQNPELGNLVLVLPSLLSLLALRFLPQHLSPSPLFSPVFELLLDPQGPPLLLLHSRRSSLHPASFSVSPSASLLLLEASSPSSEPAAFSRLHFPQRRSLLQTITDRLVLSDLSDTPPLLLLPDHSNAPALARRWHVLLDLCRSRAGVPAVDLRSLASGEGRERKSLRGFFRRNIFGRGGARGGEDARSRMLLEFLRGRETVGLTVRAVAAKVPVYRGWPAMIDARFALYKLHVEEPKEGREFAGVWGGAFGWPPSRPGEDRPGKALFLLLLSYQVVEGRVLLVATKILEGTHYVLHPNGSAMFTADFGDGLEGSEMEPFPWERDGDGQRVEVERAVVGDGIATGYGFRYPGSKPGTLYVIKDGRLAFVWRESQSVLVIERVDLGEMLNRGERVAAPPPVENFAYLTKSYSNVFMSYANNASSSLSLSPPSSSSSSSSAS